MPANIVKASNIPIFTPENDEWIGIHFKREIVTWLRYLTRMAGEDPARAPDTLHIAAVNCFV